MKKFIDKVLEDFDEKFDWLSIYSIGRKEIKSFIRQKLEEQTERLMLDEDKIKDILVLEDVYGAIGKASEAIVQAQKDKIKEKEE